MSLPLRFLPDAAHRDSLGDDFILKVRRTLRQIAARPKMFAKVHRDARKARVERFPYLVIYQVMAAEITIIAVFHTSRDPSQWQARLP
jgi:plasmid stabilization system protein ParE